MNRVRLSLVYAAAFLVLLTLGIPLPAFASDTAQEDQVCTDLSGELAIPTDSSWLTLCWSDPGAPEGAALTEVNLKILLEHPDPTKVEIQLVRAGSEVGLSLASSEINQEGLGSYTQIHAFDGLPAQGEWRIRVRSTTTGAGGKVTDFWIAPFYTPVEVWAAATGDHADEADGAGPGFTPEATDYLYLEGQFRYYDRKGVIQPAREITVEIWDEDYPGDGGADDLLYTLTVDHNGFYVVPDIVNWDVDGTSTDPAERRLDI